MIFKQLKADRKEKPLFFIKWESRKKPFDGADKLNKDRGWHLTVIDNKLSFKLELIK